MMFGLDGVWLYPLTCAVIQCMQLGTYKIMALLFVASKEWYSVSREEASFPYVLRMLMDHSSGPLVGFLGCKFKLPHVIMAGCVLTSVSVAACFFAKSILALNLFWGVLYGFGCGMSRHLQPVLLSRHFKTNLAQANGIGYLGGSVGGVIVPAIFEVLLSNYGLPGAFLVFSAINLNTIPAAMILYTTKSSSKKSLVAKEIVEEDIIFVKDTSETLCKKNVTNEDFPEENDDLHTSSNSLLMYVKYPGSISSATEVEQDMLVKRTYVDENACASVTYLKDTNSTNNDTANTCVDLVQKNNLESSKLPSKKSSQMTKIWKVFIIFLDPLFQLIAITQSLYFYTLNICLLIITDYARDIGIDVSTSVYVLISFGIGDIFSRVGLGWVTDKGYVSATNFSAICYFSCAISFSAMTFTSNLPVILVLALLTGVSVGVQMAVHPVIVNEFFEGDKKTMAMASRSFYIGPFSLTIPLLIGFFRERLGSYVWLIHFCSIIAVASGIVTLLLRSIYNSRCRTKLPQL